MTHNSIPVMTAYGAKRKAIRPYLTGNVYNITQDKLIFAFPRNELQINGFLTQNPGY